MIGTSTSDDRMSDSDPLWAELDALGGNNDLEGALAMGESSSLGTDARYIRYIGWMFAQRSDFLSAGKWYAKAFAFGAHAAESEFQTCLIELYRRGHIQDADGLARTPPLDSREGTYRTLQNLQFAADDKEGLLHSSLRLADDGLPSDSRYAAELLLARGDAETAFLYMKKAAEAGDIFASQLLGEMYMQGVGTTQSSDLAAEAYRMPAREGMLLSRSRLAHLAHSQKGRRIDVGFLITMTAIVMRVAWLRLLRPNDPTLRDIPR